MEYLDVNKWLATQLYIPQILTSVRYVPRKLSNSTSNKHTSTTARKVRRHEKGADHHGIGIPNADYR